jgi:hypothetical protein
LSESLSDSQKSINRALEIWYLQRQFILFPNLWDWRLMDAYRKWAKENDKPFDEQPLHGLGDNEISSATDDTYTRKIEREDLEIKCREAGMK